MKRRLCVRVCIYIYIFFFLFIVIIHFISFQLDAFGCIKEFCARNRKYKKTSRRRRRRHRQHT